MNDDDTPQARLDQKIEPLYETTYDLKSQLRLFSLRMDVLINEVQEHKQESRETVKTLRQEIKDTKSEFLEEFRLLRQEANASVGRVEKWLVSIVGLAFTSVVAIGIAAVNFFS